MLMLVLVLMSVTMGTTVVVKGWIRVRSAAS